MKVKLLAIALFGAIAMSSCSSSESDEYCSNPGASCPDDSAIEASACCTDQSCYWTYNGSKYQCDGTDCADVLDRITTSACVSSSTALNGETDLVVLKARLMAVTEQLLVEARAASGCEQ